MSGSLFSASLGIALTRSKLDRGYFVAGARTIVPLQTAGGTGPAPIEKPARIESRQDNIRLAQVTRKATRIRIPFHPLSAAVTSLDELRSHHTIPPHGG